MDNKKNFEDVDDIEFEESNTSNDFYKIIKNLNVNERVILTLKYVYDQKNEEIAATLKLNINTIKSITKRALEKLK